MDLSAGAAIREDALSAAGACCCQGAAAAVLLLLRRRLLFLLLDVFFFGHISYWYDNSQASFYCCIYLPSVQSTAPASNLAEPPPAASPRLGRWVCQQGLRSARIRGLLLLLLLRRRLPFLDFIRLATFCTGVTVILLLLLRLQQVRDSRHTAVCLGTSS